MFEHTKNLIEKHQVKWVDLRFTDTLGKEQHLTLPADAIHEEFFESGKLFDGSSIGGWKGIHESDMILLPDDSSAVIDLFSKDTTLLLRCDIVEPATMQPYNRDPRSIAKKAELYLKSTGIGDIAYFGPELEFFVFDSINWKIDISGSGYEIHSSEAPWSSNLQMEQGNTGHRPGIKGGYFPVPPIDSLQDMRSSIAEATEKMGVPIEVHHHEVGTAGQCEVGTRFNTLTRKADEIQIQKYCTHNTAHAFGKTATFMPKPLVGDNGSGMHVHVSISKNGKNIFSGDGYAGLSDVALFYIGGIIKHAKAINAFANASTNSYKRLIPGYEAPVILAYSSSNRSAAIRIPFSNTAQAKRIEIRFPDATANPYLLFAAILMAGLDGINNKIHPGDPANKDLYDLPPEENKHFSNVANSLDEALDALEADHEFLILSDVFSKDFIKSYIELKRLESQKISATTHPLEFDMYYSC
ncbi:MAG: type I glutamate--ammonia ligase [Endozoicomonadaceae bacterium]|nr:type I glutamate--ammonia ligase [Endozoicomonadaceae bacterium]